MKRTPMPRNTTPMTRTAPMRRTAMATATVKPHDGTCAHCSRPFTKERPMQNVCNAVCARRRVEAAKKAEKAADKARLEEFKKIPQLIATAQTAFNAFIRERDKDKTCFVCDRPFLKGVPGRVMHAGHVRTRGAAGHLRFNEDNCHGECEGCNGPHGAKPHEIEAGAIRRIGQERYDALKNSNEPHKWAKDELREIAATYRAKKLELKRGRA